MKDRIYSLAIPPSWIGDVSERPKKVFKAGDLVVCSSKRKNSNPRTDSRLTVGKIYTVKEVHGPEHQQYLVIQNDIGLAKPYSAKFFKKEIVLSEP